MRKLLDYLTQTFKCKLRVPDGTGDIEERKVGEASIVVPLETEPFLCVGGQTPNWGVCVEARQMDAICRRWMKIRGWK